MYCPQCSQPQLSEEMRFCSRCGFALGGVKELVAAGGGTISPTPKKRKKRSAMEGVKLGTWIIIASIAFLLPVLVLTAIDDDFAALLLVSVASFLVGFFRLLYAVFVQERRERKELEEQASFGLMSAQAAAGNVRKELGQPKGLPIDSFTRPIKTTAEVVQPGSVTENTTRFFDNEADDPRNRNQR